MGMQLIIHGGTSLGHEQPGAAADWNEADIVLSGARVSSIGPAKCLPAPRPHYCFDASGLLVLPGMIDIHGDAFERQIQPRPETVFAYDIALSDTDRQLVSNGITTAFHGLTYSWEGGLRGREAALALISQIAAQRLTALADHRIHLRFENHHVDGAQDVLDWIEQGCIGFLAFNEHLPSIELKSNRPEKLATYAERARCTAAVFLQRIEAARSRSGNVAGAVESIASACRKHGIPMASHDDESFSDRKRYQELGVFISEFPRTKDALYSAMAFGNHIVMGAPNVLLGGSHCGGLAASESIKAGMCAILASDYYYPSLLHAPFKLAHLGACSLAEAWQLVSRNPAQVLGLPDRGSIAVGSRADLVLVEPAPAGGARLIATIAAGKLAYCAEPARLAVNRPYPIAA
jgi:alpha-D-ribose 1-methylphosphonate 5-triphosphate diphosphatase